MSPEINFINEDFPAPLGPRIVNIFPGYISNDSNAMLHYNDRDLVGLSHQP